MKYSSIPSAQSVVSHCKEAGVKDIIISPGSRNAPLTIGFTEDNFFNCFSIVDERCAAFFALGIAQHLRLPVALVCTSGSALLNYYPAIAEAYYSNIPMLVISADRPPYKIDIGDGQTVRQENVFQNHTGYSANLKLDPICSKQPRLQATETQEEVEKYNDLVLSNALQRASFLQCPVHINVPFEEPLYETVPESSYKTSLRSLENAPLEKEENIEKFAAIWNSSPRKMILVGTHFPDQLEQKVLETIATDSSVIVFTETTSNLHHPNFFPSIDSIIAPIEKSSDKEDIFGALQPEVLLTFGGMIISKKIKAFLRSYSPKHHWHIDPNKAYDTFFCLSQHFKTDANTFFRNFLKHTLPIKSAYFNRWATVKKRYVEKRVKYLNQIPFSDMTAFNAVISAIPQEYQLQLANSSTVRYAQLFDMDPSLKVFSNRGTSGIDGSTSTAIGAALYALTPTLLISGDLSFFYDSNGLWNSYIRSDFRIIVINNGGGGIFRILPGNKATKNFEKFFETRQDLEIEKLCMLFNIEHQSVQDQTELNSAFTGFYAASKRPKLLEIRTPRLINDKILLKYFDFIS